jgi:hypothetical protein
VIVALQSTAGALALLWLIGAYAILVGGLLRALSQEMAKGEEGSRRSHRMRTALEQLLASTARLLANAARLYVDLIRLVSGERFWSAPYRMGLFLGSVMLVIFVLIPLEGRIPGGDILGELVWLVTLSTGIPRMFNNQLVVVPLRGLVVATLGARWLGVLRPTPATDSLAVLLSVATLVLMAGVILIDVFGSDLRSVERILGAIAAYLLFALIWAYGYRLLETFSPGSFRPPLPAWRPVGLPWPMMYFSLTTLTTLGYGDITMTHPVGQSMAMLEAVLGLMYPAVLIGRLVGDWSAK